MLKKIVFIGPLPPPLGGVAMINQSFQELDYQGCETMSFNTSNNKQNEDLYKGLPWNNIGKEYKKIQNLKTFLRLKQPDIANVFVTSGYSIIRDLFYLRILYKKKIPIIIHFHSKKKGEFALAPRRLNFVGKLFNKYAQKIILLSPDHFDYFTSFFNKNKCDVLENFVDYNNFDNEITEKTSEFLYVGRLSKEKGFFDLLEACKLLKEKGSILKVNVIGAAPNDSVEQEINTFIKQHALNVIIHLHGLKFGSEKYDLFKRAKILVFPSHFENSPVVIKEAIAAKMAIIASNIEPNKNILNAIKNNSMHMAQNPEDLANKIEILLNSESLVNQFCVESEKVKEYDKTYANEKLTSIINELC